METREEKWWARMLATHYTVEAVKAHMKERANLSSRNSKGTGGFNYLKRTDPERLRALSVKGGKVSAKKETHQSAKRSQSA